VRILVTGWFSFDTAEVTAGDLAARDTAVRWLAESGLPHDVAVAENFRGRGDVGLTEADPDSYTDVVFVCGPASGKLVEEMFGRFPHARHVALGVSAVDGTARLPLDVLLERDSEAVVRPDLSLAASTAAGRTQVIGVILGHEQPEYGARHRLADAHALLGEALSSVDVARVLLDTRLHPCEPHLCRTPAQVESALARCDAVATTRMHGLALALKGGVPALGVDPVAGGGKVSRQAEALGWPAVARVGETAAGELAGLLRWCLSAEAAAMAGAVAGQVQPALEEIRERFIALFTTPSTNAPNAETHPLPAMSSRTRVPSRGPGCRHADPGYGTRSTAAVCRTDARGQLCGGVAVPWYDRVAAGSAENGPVAPGDAGDVPSAAELTPQFLNRGGIVPGRRVARGPRCLLVVVDGRMVHGSSPAWLADKPPLCCSTCRDQGSSHLLHTD
jgi:hypothetical protein